MSAQNAVKILYDASVSHSWVHEYRESLKAGGVQVIIKEEEDDGFCNFTGKEIHDILVCISGESFKIISETIITTILSESFKTLWKKITKAKLKEAKCRLQINAEGKQINVEISGAIDEKTISGAVEGFIKGMSDQTVISYFSETDFLEPDVKPKIRLYYNLETMKWEPVNYAESKMEWEEILRRAHQTISD
jgi:hypothetical protein